ncbi:anthranilate phosphoribosyltransferase [Entomortierella chlamydospora]|uniref:Anthranilate phosphoribosyltransferase n=1 Tax=Entomortierella chlamydospora TaxID=101097 RepID=A0A9P6SWT1_9FUNG|nr:anthranilate phosphoribosyltransferase [Entomortierella chlamydospora]KAG0008893.1 anthranilate phosphoribosyltransferase [Entomortierella chlamydospora]
MSSEPAPQRVPAIKSAMHPILQKLVHKPETFTVTDAAVATKEIMEGRATQAQIGAYLVALKLNKLDADPSIVAACAVEMKNHGLPISFEKYPHLEEQLVDIVGTGGDGHDTFNVSTTAAIVAAGAGCKVAKHGNRAASSACGSADILEKIGCRIDNVQPDQVAPLLDSHGFCFLFAQTYHPAMKNTSAPRKELGVPSIFNLMGPLSNPAKPGRVVVGVHSRLLGSLMIQSLKLMGLISGMVVCGANGLDEISPEAETHVWKLVDGEIVEEDISPAQFGLPSHPLISVKGGGPVENAQILDDLLNNKFKSPGHPILDFVLLNAAALLVVAGKADNFEDAVVIARESVESGKARAVLEGFRRDIQ